MREHFNLSAFLSSISDLTIDRQIDRLREQYDILMNSRIVTMDSIERSRIDELAGRSISLDWRRRAHTAARTYGHQIAQIEFAISRLRRARHLESSRATRFVEAAREILDTDTFHTILDRAARPGTNNENAHP